MTSVGRTSVVLAALIAGGVLVAFLVDKPGKSRTEVTTQEKVEVTTRGKLTVTTRGKVTALSMPLEGPFAGAGAGGRLVTLPTGCVAVRPTGTDDNLVLIWPSGTTIDSAGTISSSLGNFWVGQEVIGGAEFWSPAQLNPSGSVVKVCPSDRYVQLVHLQIGQDGPR